jgi:hypothetical protein
MIAVALTGSRELDVTTHIDTVRDAAGALQQQLEELRAASGP